MTSPLFTGISRAKADSIRLKHGQFYRYVKGICDLRKTTVKTLSEPIELVKMTLGEIADEYRLEDNPLFWREMPVEKFIALTLTPKERLTDKTDDYYQAFLALCRDYWTKSASYLEAEEAHQLGWGSKLTLDSTFTIDVRKLKNLLDYKIFNYYQANPQNAPQNT